MVGNFPQAFSHLALVIAAMVLEGVVATSSEGAHASG
jgi:GH15 family glucan-1,4-alpha-glucosidase